MGRKERRDLERQGFSKETARKADALNSPCTVLEAVQLAQGVVEDKLTEYKASTVPLTVSHTLHIEVMKEVLISKGLVTEEEFKDLYMKAAERYQAEKLKYEAEIAESEVEPSKEKPEEESKES